MFVDDVRKAHVRIKKYIKKTPLIFSEKYSKLVSGKVYLKLESQQATHSFKARGALNKMLVLTEEEKKKGVITASAGNHAQGVGLAAKKLGIKARIVVPKTAPDVKIDAIRSYGVDLVLYGEIFDKAEDFAISQAKKTGMIYVSPYNDRKVIEGNGTIALEVLRENPDVDVFIVPVGGGGLISGISHAAKGVKPGVEVVGVQSEAAPGMYESLKKGKPVEAKLKKSIADGIHENVDPRSITFGIVRKYVDEIVLVSENEICQSIRDYYSEYKQPIEGAAAVGLAALKRYKEKFEGKNVVIIISGANIDKDDLDKILRGDKMGDQERLERFERRKKKYRGYKKGYRRRYKKKSD